MNLNRKEKRILEKYRKILSRKDTLGYAYEKNSEKWRHANHLLTQIARAHKNQMWVNDDQQPDNFGRNKAKRERRARGQK